MQSQTKTDAETLRPLAERILDLSQRPSEAEKKKLWADHQALKPVSRVPISVYYEGIPTRQWSIALGDNFIKCSGALARSIELDLRVRIWMAENVPDDRIVWPTILVNAPVIERQGWGVEMKWKYSEDELGAKGYDPPFADEIDLDRLTVPILEHDPKAVADTVAEARELVSGLLTVYPVYADLDTFAPFDTATSMRGMENLLLDTALEPDKVIGLMDFITSATVLHLQRREENGWLNVHPDSTKKYQQVGFRVQCAYLGDDFSSRKPKLSDEWVYISQQTSAGLGPRDYARFVNPSNVQLALPFVNDTVYYHGCECLDEKMEILAELPHLRRFHVSPWTSLSKARDKFQGRVVLEVHDHPGKVFFSDSPEETRARVRWLLDTADGHPMDLNLSDISSVNDNFALLTRWAEIARQEIDLVCG
jgi:hypothetical protein